MIQNRTELIKEYFDSMAIERDSWKDKNRYYHQLIERFYKQIIPEKKSVLEIGCGTGDLLNSVKPMYGLGIDISQGMLKIARKKFPKLVFKSLDVQQLDLQNKFDYMIASDLIGNLEDVQKAFLEMSKVADQQTRIVITYYNLLWEPILNLAVWMGFRMPQPFQNWLSDEDIENLLFLSDLEVVKKGKMILLPINIPIASYVLNKFFAKMPIIRKLCLSSYFIIRKKPNIYSDKEYTVSVIIPARNEQGNIEKAILRVPKLGKSTEIIFVEGGSRDNTLQEIKKMIKKYESQREIKLIEQGEGLGKADAVRKGFAAASGEVLMILDADLTVDPEELPKFYQIIRTGKSELVIGSRLVYPMEEQAMRLLNIFGNKFFSLAFSWLLDQSIKDTLCGTKVLLKEDYLEIVKNRSYFGNFDPFGDYDLIFGATKLNLKISQIPIRYRARTYGTTNISRFRHGWLLLKMTFVAAKKIKFVL